MERRDWECEVLFDGMRLKHVSEFKYLGCVLAECHGKVASTKRVADAIRYLGNLLGLQLECVRVLHESLLVPVLMMVVKQ